jgi:hypothetical protein
MAECDWRPNPVRQEMAELPQVARIGFDSMGGGSPLGRQA